MIERPTIELKTKERKGISHTIVLKEWITGREEEYIQEPIINAASFKAGLVSGAPSAEMTDFKISAITVSEHRTIEVMVISVDGQTEKVVDLVLDMHKDDKQEIVEKINELLKKK